MCPRPSISSGLISDVSKVRIAAGMSLELSMDLMNAPQVPAAPWPVNARPGRRVRRSLGRQNPRQFRGVEVAAGDDGGGVQAAELRRRGRRSGARALHDHVVVGGEGADRVLDLSEADD